MPPGETIQKAWDNPVLLIIVIVILGLLLIVNAAEKLGGKLGATIRAWTAGRRRAAQEADDADITDLRRQVEYLTKRVDQLTSAQAEHYQVLVAHQSWDNQALQALPAQSTVGAPPPLWPITPPAPPIT